MEDKKYNLKNDIIFKAFFSRKGNEEFLKDFLNALLGIEIETIKIKEEVNLEQLSAMEKGGRLDLQATLNERQIVNIIEKDESEKYVLYENSARVDVDRKLEDEKYRMEFYFLPSVAKKLGVADYIVGVDCGIDEIL